MTTETAEKLSAAGRDASRPVGDPNPGKLETPTLPAARWRTYLHRYVDVGDVLVQHGRIQIILQPIQWVIAKKRKTRNEWEAFSFHREVASLMRVLSEQQRIQGNESLVDDLEGCRLELMRL